MGILKSVFNMVKKPLDVAMKMLPIAIGGTLPNIISIATTAAPLISEIIVGRKSDSGLKDIQHIHGDARTMAVKANMDNPDVNILSVEAASYLSGLTKEFSAMVNDLGITKAELDEFTALYILERLNCPVKYTEAILKTLRLNRRIKESGIINDAIETSKLHADNIKNVFNIGREMYSTDYIISELERDMKPKKIITSEGVDLYNKRHDQLEIILDMAKDTGSLKGMKKVENKIDKIMVNDHQKFVNDYMVKHFKLIKEKAEKDSDDYIFLFGRNH